MTGKKPSTFLNKEKQDVLCDILKKNIDCKITFLKVTNNMRRTILTSGIVKTYTPKNKTSPLCVVFDKHRNGYRSFYLDKVQNVNVS